MRLRKQKRDSVVVSFDQQEAGDWVDIVDHLADERNEAPTTTIQRTQIRQLLERRIDELFRCHAPHRLHPARSRRDER